LEHTFELRPEPFAGRDILRNYDELTEEIVGKLDIKRQIKSDRAASDIGAPFLDIRILAEDLIELGRAIAFLPAGPPSSAIWPMSPRAG
jgi:hypothetical protein